MAAARSPLLRRIEALLRRDPGQPARGMPRRAGFAMAVVLAGACLLPTLRVRGDDLRHAPWRDVVADLLPSAGPRTHILTRWPEGALDVWIKGQATLREDSDDLRTGQVTVSETSGGVSRRIEIDADAGGTVSRRYFLDGRPHALDADARRWVEHRWNMVVSNLLNPAQRVDRLLQRGGPDAVMQAIEHPVDIGTQHALIGAWAGTRTLDEDTVQRLIVAADRAEPAGDDFDRLQSLRDIAARQQLTLDQKARFVNAVATRAANSESAGALQALIAQLDANTPPGTVAATVNALRGLPSDFARRDVLEHALDHGSATAAELALQVTPGFQSEFDHRDLLEHVARRLATMNNAGMVERYADSARNLRQPFERRSALLALVEATPLNPDGCRAVLDALAGLDSPADVTPVLLALARRMSPEAGLVARYRQVARVLPAFERGQTEQALDALPQPA